MKIKIKRTHQDALVPAYQTPGASGFDVHSLFDYEILAGQTILVDTGIAFEIPVGYELQVRPRSGVSLKTLLRVANAPGTVDSDFRDSVKVIIHNASTKDAYHISKGDRVAQCVLTPVIQAEFVEAELSETERGVGGFGSTGK